MPTVLLLCAPPLEPGERPTPFASLTPAQARSLEGKLRLYKVTLDSMGMEHDGRVGPSTARAWSISGSTAPASAKSSTTRPT
jgi:hypothetical protein